MIIRGASMLRMIGLSKPQQSSQSLSVSTELVKKIENLITEHVTSSSTAKLWGELEGHSVWNKAKNAYTMLPVIPGAVEFGGSVVPYDAALFIDFRDVLNQLSADNIEYPQNRYIQDAAEAHSLFLAELAALVQHLGSTRPDQSSQQEYSHLSVKLSKISRHIETTLVSLRNARTTEQKAAAIAKLLAGMLADPIEQDITQATMIPVALEKVVEKIKDYQDGRSSDTKRVKKALKKLINSSQGFNHRLALIKPKESEGHERLLFSPNFCWSSSSSWS